MDLQTALVCLAVFLVSAVVVYLISVLGMRETTYEEAIAQQRLKDEETLHLKKSDKTSGKVDKKHKKWGRKSKEKSEGKTEESAGDDVRVGFKEETEIIPEVIDEERRPSVINGKSKDPKSILVNKKQAKEKSPPTGLDESKEIKVQAEVEVVASQQVVEVKSQPAKVKSESRSKDGSPTPADNTSKSSGGRKSRESSNDKEENAKKAVETKIKELKKDVAEIVPVPIVTALPVEIPIASVPPPTPVKKTKKIVKAEEEILTCNRLTNIIKSSALSPNEITSLIETLLNKQQAESGNEEWLKIGQKVDPITSLRKQLQEKEEALAEEKSRSQTSGAKVKELRQELNTEKTRLAQLERNLKDRHQQEIQTTHSHLQMATAEAHNLRIQVQQLQAKLNEEANSHIEEKTQMAQALTHSENNFSGLQREAEELRNTVMERQNHILSSNDSTEKLINDNQLLQERVNELEISKQENDNADKNQINELTLQLHVVGDEKAYLMKLVEEAEPLKEEVINLRHSLEQLTTSVSHNEDAKNRLHALIEEVKQEKLGLDKQLTNLQIQYNQLNTDFKTVNDELGALKEENELLAAQLSKVSEREEAEGQEGSGDSTFHKSNGHIQVPTLESDDTVKIPLTEHEHILHEKEKVVERITSELNEKNNELTEICNQLLITKEEVTRLASEGNLQKQKNNELREKNWKIVEALDKAEKSTNDKIRQADKIANERLSDVQKQEQTFTQDVLERLFPEISLEKSIVYPEWVSRFEKQAQQTIEHLRTTLSQSNVSDELRVKFNNLEEVNNVLQSKIDNYKVVLAETESMLNKLQGSVEEEELRWKEKLEAKDLELQKLLEERRSFEISLDQVKAAENAAAEMQVKLKELHEKLQTEENERRLLEKYKLEAEKSASHFHEQLKEAEDQLQKLKLEKESMSESAKELETQKIELERLKQQLKELSSCNVKLNGQLKIGQDAIKAEQNQVNILEEELKLLRNEKKQSNATNGQTTDNGDSVTHESRCKVEPDINSPSLVMTTQSSPLSYISQATPNPDPNSSVTDLLISGKKSKSKKRFHNVSRSPTNILGCFG